MISTENTRTILKIIDATATSVGQAPDGCRPTVQTALTQIRGILGMQGQVQAAAWLNVVAAVLREGEL